MLLCHCESGKEKGGFIATTRAVGFNGTAATIWGGVFLQKMLGRLRDGVQWNGMQLRLEKIVDKAIYTVAPGNDRHCCIGLTTLENYS